jgi:signal peptidase I
MNHKNFSKLLISIIFSSTLFGCSIPGKSFENVGMSMEPTIQDGEIVNIIESKTFAQGDIIVFHPEGLESEFYLKRIIGVPGDSVQLKGGAVFVNDTEIKETYLSDGMKTCIPAHSRNCDKQDKVFTVPAEKYFVLGDKRNGSSDSRNFRDNNDNPDPYVSKNNIRGKVQL